MAERAEASSLWYALITLICSYHHHHHRKAVVRRLRHACAGGKSASHPYRAKGKDVHELPPLLGRRAATGKEADRGCALDEEGAWDGVLCRRRGQQRIQGQDALADELGEVHKPALPAVLLLDHHHQCLGERHQRQRRKRIAHARTRSHL